MLGPPGFFANKESNIYVAEPHEAGAAVLNRHRYDVYDVYIFGWDFEV